MTTGEGECVTQGGSGSEGGPSKEVEDYVVIVGVDTRVTVPRSEEEMKLSSSLLREFVFAS